MVQIILDILITGLILGGIYALIAVGLTLQYSVGRVLNVAHGEFILVGALATYTLYTAFDISPPIAITIIPPALFFLGYLIDRTLFNHLRKTSDNTDAFSGRSLLASF